MDFFKNKKVLVTGHTGFKGSWMCKMLSMQGARIAGYSLFPERSDSLFYISDSVNLLEKHVIGDIRDIASLEKLFIEFEPEIVIHMAAQPLVIESYHRPRETYEVNVMGTVNVLECIRKNTSTKLFLNVTTDKVYKPVCGSHAFLEDEKLGGHDPYADSKACSELVTSSYYNSFFHSRDLTVITARSGNVIGGGDVSENRIIPDCIRFAQNGGPIIIRNPHAVRPYQFVLDAVHAYLFMIEKHYNLPKVFTSYNIGPLPNDCLPNYQLVDLFCKHWGKGLSWEVDTSMNVYHENPLLMLSIEKIQSELGWEPSTTLDEAVYKTIEFVHAFESGKVKEVMENQILDIINKQLVYM